MSVAISLANQIHIRALEVSARFKRSQFELVEVIQKLDEHRVFLKLGHSSLFRYVTRVLGLCEGTAYDLINVARKARQVPALKSNLEAGKLTLSKARRVSSVLTAENQEEWLARACALSSRALEREIARVRPQAATPERATYVSGDRVRLELGLSERAMLELRRVQDLLCQSRRRAVSLEEAIGAMTSEYIKRHDPVAKARRHQVKKGALGTGRVEPLSAVSSGEVRGGLGTGQVGSETAPPESLVELGTGGVSEAKVSTTPALGTRQAYERTPIPAAILHAVNLRDQRRCAQVQEDGTRCGEARWVDIHHKILVSQGGTHALDNLITLCSAHHKFRHLSPNREAG
jgi:hypothetical protein